MKSEKKKAFIILVSLLSIVILYWCYSMIIVNRNKSNKIQKGMVIAENNFERLKNERANYASVKSEWEKKTHEFDTLYVHIPLKENIRGSNSYISTLDIIYQIANDNNVSINKINPILENTFPDIGVENGLLPHHIERYLVEIECNGDFFSIGNFFEDIQNHNRTVNIRKFKIATEFRSRGGLLCEIILNTYVFSEI